jgi:predicted RNase H-like HicB family nuclease
MTEKAPICKKCKQEMELDPEWNVWSCHNCAPLQQYRLPVIAYEDGDQFVAVCPPLGVASQGKDIGQALVNIRDAVELYLEADADTQAEADSTIGSMYVYTEMDFIVERKDEEIEEESQEEEEEDEEEEDDDIGDDDE